MIKIQGVSQRFKSKNGTVDAVRDVNIDIPKGQIFGIIGRSGAGKSTLVRTINMLNRPTSGKIIFDGKDMGALSSRDLLHARREIGMIFQHFNLLSSRTVFDNVAFPLELSGKSKADIKKRVDELLELVGLTQLKDRYPAQLSGGQKQRVGIARALANNPKVLLSDESTSALDPETTRSILDLLKRINRELGLTIVLITHQMEVIKQICDRVAVMNAGEVIEQGSVLDIFLNPKSPVTLAMIGNLIAQELPNTVLERVRTHLSRPHANKDHLLRLAFTDSDVDQPLLSDTIHRYDLNFSILHGQIDEIQGQAFGSLATLVNGTEANIQSAVEYLRSKGVIVEELDHVI